MTHFTAADGLVITMLGVMILSFGIVGTLLFSIRRNMMRRDPSIERLLEEVALIEEAENAPSTVTKIPESKALPWERDADWWKK